MTDSTPAPGIDADSRPFWDGLERGAVVLYECAACGMRSLPLLPTCRACASSERRLVEVDGTGTVYSWIKVHRAVTRRFASEVPYIVATIDLDGGCRCFGRMDAGVPVAVGMRVGPAFHAHDGWTELRFEPVVSGDGARA